MAVTPSAGSKKVASVHADIGADTSGFERGATSVKGGLVGISGAIAIVTTGLSIMSKAFELGEEAAKLQRLADAGDEVARQYGGSMDLIIEKVREASLGAVSEMDIIRSANKAMMLGLGADADQLANLMEIAAFRGRAMGVSTTQAFDDIVRGVGRASPLILDNLGIVVKLGDVNEEYAASVGKTVQQLTAAEKKQALLNAVLSEGNQMLADAGGLAEDNATAYERWNAELENTKNSLVGINSPMSRFADMGADLLITFRELGENGIGITNGKLNGFNLLMEFATKRIANGNEELERQVQSIRNVEAARMNGIAATYGAIGAEDAFTLSIEEQEAAIKASSDANKDFIGVLGDMQRESESFNEKYSEISNDQNLSDDERKAKLQELAAEHELYTRRVVLGLLEQKFMQDGILTDDEMNWLLEKGVAWGIYSDTVVSESKRAFDEANNLATALANMPKEGTFTFFLNSVGDISGVVKAASAANQIEQRRASGGSVNAGQPYLVGERGMELFTPSQDGTITPNHKLGRGGSNMTVNIMLDSGTPDPERVAYNLKPAILRVLRDIQQ